MVDKEYIEKNINLIFDVEKHNIKNNKIFHFVEVSSEADIKTKDGSVPIRYAARPPLVDMELNPNDNFKLEWDTYTYLKKLYNKIEHFPGCRDIFLNTLEQKLSKLGAIDVPIYVDSPKMIYTAYKLHSRASLALLSRFSITCENSCL